MKELTFLLNTLLLVANICPAQITFQNTYSATNFGASAGFTVETTLDSGFIIAGNCIGSGNSDACITKTDFNGNVQWSEALGNLRAENIFSVKQITTGSYIIAGTSRSFSVDSLNQFYVLKLSPTGNVEWENTYGSLLGGVELSAHRINLTSDGGFIIGGSKDDALMGMGIMYLKTDSAGTVSWGKYISGSLGSYGVESIRQTSDTGYIITGNGGHLIKTNSIGNITWSKSYIGGSMSFDALQTADGGYILAGETNVYGAGAIDMYLIKTDSTGNVLWCKTYGGSLDDNLRSAEQTSDGGYILQGSTNSFGVGSTDIYLVKTDSAGTPLWSKTYGSTGTELGFSAGEIPAGGFFISGYTNSFGNGTNATYLIKTDTAGTSGCNESSPVTLVTNPTITAVAHNDSSIVYNPDTFTPFSNINGGLNASVLCAIVTSTFEETLRYSEDITISPNPARNNFTISFKNVITKGKIDLQTIFGQKILAENISDKSKIDFSIENILEGIYFVKVFDGKKYYCKKLIVEHD